MKRFARHVITGVCSHQTASALSVRRTTMTRKPSAGISRRCLRSSELEKLSDMRKAGTVVHCHSARFSYASYLNITPPEMVRVYGNDRISVSPSSMVTNAEYTSSPLPGRSSGASGYSDRAYLSPSISQSLFIHKRYCRSHECHRQS